MSESALLYALAEAFDAASGVLRLRAALVEPRDRVSTMGSVDRARAVHPQLGPRQAEVIELLEQHGPNGTNTGVLSRSMNYDQPNVYLTLRSLVGLGFVEKDESVIPHNYRLAGPLQDGALSHETTIAS